MKAIGLCLTLISFLEIHLNYFLMQLIYLSIYEISEYNILLTHCQKVRKRHLWKTVHQPNQLFSNIVFPLICNEQSAILTLIDVAAPQSNDYTVKLTKTVELVFIKMALTLWASGLPACIQTSSQNTLLFINLSRWKFECKYVLLCKQVSWFQPKGTSCLAQAVPLSLFWSALSYWHSFPFIERH